MNTSRKLGAIVAAAVILGTQPAFATDCATPVESMTLAIESVEIDGTPASTDGYKLVTLSASSDGEAPLVYFSAGSQGFSAQRTGP